MKKLNTEALAKISPKLIKLCGEYLTADEKSYLLPTLLRWAGSDEKATAWFLNEKIPACGNKTAFELCKNKNTGQLIQNIRHIELGGFS